MPYIKSDDSRRVDLQKGKQPKTAGELNYQIFWFLKPIGMQIGQIK